MVILHIRMPDALCNCLTLFVEDRYPHFIEIADGLHLDMDICLLFVQIDIRNDDDIFDVAARCRINLHRAMQTCIIKEVKVLIHFAYGCWPFSSLSLTIVTDGQGCVV